MKKFVLLLGLAFALTASAYEKFLWVELIGFDNTKPDYGVEEFLSRMDKKPSAISILLTEHSFFHEHAGLAKDFVLPEGVTSYDSRPKNEERARQNWTAYQLRGLVAEIKKRHIDVFPSFFEWGIFDICGKTENGEPYVDFFIRQTLAFLKDYGFTGLHASDGFGHPRLGLGQRDPKVTDWRKAADDWTAFWRKASKALKQQGYKMYLNTVWTRDPYDALVRYGLDYDGLCETDIDGFICESSASVLELEGWNLTEDTTLDKSVAMLTRLGTCVRGRKPIYLLHCIKDGNEQYNALRHSPPRAVAEAMAMAGVSCDGRRTLVGEMACLADGITRDEWKMLDSTWAASFLPRTTTPSGCQVVWSERAFRAECETLPKMEVASSCTLLSKLIRKGAAVDGGVTFERAVADKSIPLLILNPGCFPAAERAALKDRSVAVVEFGYGVDEMSVEPDVARGHYWPWPMFEKLPTEKAFAAAVKGINAAAAVHPVEGAPDQAVSSFLGEDGCRYVMVRNERTVYLGSEFKVWDGVADVASLTLDPSAPVSVLSDAKGATLKAKLPPSGAIMLRCRLSGGASALPNENTIREWFERFRMDDRERDQNTIWNYRAFSWLKDAIPLFDCPDEDIVRTYYYRWWTFRKHFRKTDAGWVVTASRPDPEWTGVAGVCADLADLHLREGRWMRTSLFIDDYRRFMEGPGKTAGRLPKKTNAESAELTKMYQAFQAGDVQDEKNGDNNSFRECFAKKLKEFAVRHQCVRERDGKTIPWADPVLDSTFCDLVIAGLCGVCPHSDGSIEIKPLVPKTWDWWCLDRLRWKGRDYRIVFDRDGTHYNQGKGLRILPL